MANKNLYDWTAFTDNEDALDLVGHMIRWGMAPAKYSDKDTFKAIALSDTYELASSEAMAIDGGSTDPAGGAAARLAFKGRIVGENSPHWLLPNPCDPTWSSNAGETWRVIDLHTTFLSTSTTKATPVTRGDVVLVKLRRSGQSYDLKYGTFEELINVEDPTAGSSDQCSALVSLFGEITHQPFNIGGPAIRSGGPPVPPGELYSPDSPRAGLDRSKTRCGSQSKVTAETRRFFSSVQKKAFDKSSQAEMFGNGNWRYQQPDLGELRTFIETHKINKIIRLNGSSGGDLKYSYDSQTGLCVGIDLEEEFAKYINPAVQVKKISAHAGFKRGKGYTRSVSDCNEWFDEGNTLVHCTHGADRTGFVVAAWIQKENRLGDEARGIPNIGGKEALWDYATRFNSWKKYICSSGDLGYVAYLDAFYPADEFCAAGTRATSCAACKSKHFQFVYVVSPTLAAGDPQWEQMREKGYWEYTNKEKTKWRWRWKKSGGA